MYRRPWVWKLTEPEYDSGDGRYGSSSESSDSSSDDDSYDKLTIRFEKLVEDLIDEINYELTNREFTCPYYSEFSPVIGIPSFYGRDYYDYDGDVICICAISMHQQNQTEVIPIRLTLEPYCITITQFLGDDILITRERCDRVKNSFNRITSEYIVSEICDSYIFNNASSVYLEKIKQTKIMAALVIKEKTNAYIARYIIFTLFGKYCNSFINVFDNLIYS